MRRIVMIALFLSANVFAADRALEIKVSASRPSSDFESVNYVMQATVARLVGELAVGRFALLTPQGEGRLVSTYCVELNRTSRDSDLGKLKNIFASVTVNAASEVRYETTEVPSCP